MEARIAKLEAAVEHIQADTTEIKGDLRGLRGGLGGLRGEMNVGLRDIRTEASSAFRWLVGLSLAGATGLAGLVARGFGWL
jgi:hypothetical protein